MSWKPIVVGVDASPAAAAAAQLGLQIAGAASAECRLVHAARDNWSLLAAAQVPQQAAAFRDAALAAARNQLATVLAGHVAAAAIRNLVVREGWPPAVLDDAAREADASMLVLGAKHHTALGRWLGGSTVHNVARMLRTPLLVTGMPPAAIRRVLVALDASRAAQPTLDHARRIAELFDAELRALHVIEPLPIIPEVPPPTNPEDYERLLTQECETKIWPLLPPDTGRAIRHTAAEAGIAAEATAWQADLVVVGSHGKGFVERMLVGSVTERLLGHLPAPMLLVVPVARLAANPQPQIAAKRMLATAV
jgi:nucleotide-binding universal stress UspA family protein